MRRAGNRQGAMLVIVVVASLICSVLAYGALYLALAQARRSEAMRQRAQARYAAEAAMVWAMQQLWNDPTWSAPGAGIPVPVAIAGVNQLTVRYTNCVAPPCPPSALTVVARN